jgi:hypothetical protein
VLPAEPVVVPELPLLPVEVVLVVEPVLPLEPETTSIELEACAPVFGFVTVTV